MAGEEVSAELPMTIEVDYFIEKINQKQIENKLSLQRKF